MIKPNDFAALEGRTVTEAHATICRERGHATYTKDGVPSTSCPRCGDINTQNIKVGDMIRLDSARGWFVVDKIVNYHDTTLETEFHILDAEGPVGWVLVSDIIGHETRTR